MKLITYQHNGKEQIGVLDHTEECVFPISCANIEYSSMLELIRNITREEFSKLAALTRKTCKSIPAVIPRHEIKLLAPIPNPAQDVICLGVNYHEPINESDNVHPKTCESEHQYAIYFSKRVNRAVADGESIPSHSDIVDSLDYEAELAVIIGKDAFRVDQENAASYIFGYTILNDISARNLQTQHKQWYFGKSLDGFTPVGPCIVTANDFSFPPCLRITTVVNGQRRQDSNTSFLITGIAQTISELSQGMTLRAGTIIATGTPSGIGIGFQPPKFLNPGDTVICTVEGIGSLTNYISI